MVNPKAAACSATLCVSNKICNKMAYSKKFAGKKTGSHIIPLADENTKVVYFERDSYNPKTVVNVLDENKNRIYSFERAPKSMMCLPSGSLVPWDFITANHRKIIGAVGVKKEKYWVEFCNKGEMTYRLVKPQKKCFKPKYQQFKQESDDMARFRWSRYGMTLDKVTLSHNNSCSKIRRRVAYARKLSFLKCKSPLKKLAMKSQSKTIIDYEVTYDATLIDRELLIATAFISMLTQWKTAKQQRSVAVSRISKKAQIKMIKAKAFIKAKRCVTVGALATEGKAEMGMVKAKTAKGKLVKFMGGTVPPTMENPTGDPTFTRGRYGNKMIEKKISMAGGLSGCLPSSSCVPKIFPACDDMRKAPPPDRLSDGSLVHEGGTCNSAMVGQGCKSFEVPASAPVYAVQQPASVSSGFCGQMPAQTASLVVPQTSVNIGYPQPSQQGISAPIQFNHFNQGMMSAPLRSQPYGFQGPCAARSTHMSQPRLRQLHGTKPPYPTASLLAPMRQVFPPVRAVPASSFECRSAPVMVQRARCMPPACKMKSRPACGQVGAVSPINCGLQKQSCLL